MKVVPSMLISLQVFWKAGGMLSYELIAPDIAECMDRYCSKHGHTPFTLLLLLVAEYTVP